MAEVEVAFKVRDKQSKCEKLLKKAGYKLFWKAKTHDIYFTKQELTAEMSEQELKFACVRIRCSNGGYSVDNYHTYNHSKPNKFKCTKDDAIQIAEELDNSGLVKVFDTSKSDVVYKRGNRYHQLQDIEGIGLLDYVYDEDIKKEPENVQVEILQQEMTDVGIALEYKNGVDKLRTLLNNGDLCFSHNKNGNYNLTQTENS